MPTVVAEQLAWAEYRDPIAWARTLDLIINDCEDHGGSPRNWDDDDEPGQEEPGREEPEAEPGPEDDADTVTRDPGR